MWYKLKISKRAISIVFLITSDRQLQHVFINYYTSTNTLLYTVFIPKFTLKHLKSSYMFRSIDHPQGAHVVPC
jgi:hypothetical protein